MTVSLHRGDRAADALDTAWDDLVLRQEIPNPTMTSTWLREVLTAEEGEALVVRVSSGGRLVAGGAFGVRPLVRGSRLSVLTWVGPEEDWASPHALVDRRSPDAATALVDAIAEVASAIDISVPSTCALADALRSRLTHVDERPRTDLWITRLPPPRMKHAEERAAYERRRSERRGSPVSIAIARSPDEAAPALERMFEVHEARWADDPHAIRRFSATAAQRDWYRRVVSRMSARDSVRIVEVREGDAVVGAILGLVAGRGAMFHIMAVRPGDGLRQPGHVALLEWVRLATEEGCEIMDLGWGAGQPNSPKARLGPSNIAIHQFIGGMRRAGPAVLVARRYAGVQRARSAQQLARLVAASRISAR